MGSAASAGPLGLRTAVEMVSWVVAIVAKASQAARPGVACAG